MKVTIIGGGGLVGSSAGFALQCGGVVREIALLDVNLELAGGQALDLLHGGPSTADQIITSGGYEHVPVERRDLHHGRPAPQAGRSRGWT